MNVLEIIADGSPGGGTTNVLGLIEDLKNSECFHPEFITQKNSYGLKKAQKMNTPSSGINFFRSRLDIGVSIQLKRIIARLSPDLIHVHGLRAAFFLTYLGLKAPNIPSIYTVRGYHFPKRFLPLQQLLILAESRVTSLLNQTIFVCKYDRNLAKKNRIIDQSSQVDIVYNGLNLEDFPEAEKTSPYCVAFLGRLTYQKNVECVLEVIAQLNKSKYNFKIIGGGDREDWFIDRINKMKVQNSVEITGLLPRQQALKELNDAGILLMPSRWEGFPVTPLEAMALKVPVVASTAGGIPEIIDNEKNGLLIEENDPKKYVEAIKRLTENKQLRNQVISKGIHTVQTNFQRVQTSTKYKRIYKHFTV